MKEFAVILDRDYSNSPICQIIESSDFDVNLERIKIYDPYGAYASIAKEAYRIQQLRPLTLHSAQNSQPIPAHICQITQLSPP